MLASCEIGASPSQPPKTREPLATGGDGDAASESHAETRMKPSGGSRTSPRAFDPPVSLADGSAAAQVAAIYEDFHRLLMWIATVKFKVPSDAAEACIHEVMLSLMQVGVRIEDVRSWLVAGVCNSCRQYWRQHAYRERHEQTDIDITTIIDGRDFAEFVERQLLIADVLRSLTSRQRLALRLHYLEGCTAREIAVRLNTTARYAEKLIHRSLVQAREALDDPRMSGGANRPHLPLLPQGVTGASRSLPTENVRFVRVCEGGSSGEE